MEPVDRRGREEVESVGRQRRHGQRRGPDVVDRVAERHGRWQRGPHRRGREGPVGDEERHAQVRRRLDPDGSRPSLDHRDDAEAAEDRGRGVVGVAFRGRRELELALEGQGAASEQGIGRGQGGDRRRCRRAEAPSDRDRVVHVDPPAGPLVGQAGVPEGALQHGDEAVRPVGRETVGPFARDPDEDTRPRRRLDDLDVDGVDDVERDRQRVEPGSEVRARRGHLDA